MQTDRILLYAADQPRHEREVIVGVLQPDEIRASFRDCFERFRGHRHRRSARNVIDQKRKLQNR